ncbi:MAG: metallophosphoesterase [Lachnospiraceae bacterium]|jgi:putative phosphoesterase|nr:metallophosphoesterase [Lachnospiraceae bacterium]
MKVLIVSDTHRRHGNLETVLENVGKMDLLIHLGDAEGEEDYIEAIAGCPVEIIAGNNDFFSNLDKEKVILLGKYKVLLTHGHYYNVTVGVERLKEEARERGIDIAMFGHTHRPYLEIGNELVILNPGSISFPRQEGRKPSYILMEIDDRGEAHFTINYLK